MLRQLSVHLLPALMEPSDVRSGVTVIVDILRASTTISHALANGAAGVMPCGSVDEAVAVRNQASPGGCLLGGERGGIKIDGFDLSNSPDDYSSDVVEGKLIGFTTTNGTKALLRSIEADEILIGAFVNFSVVEEHCLRSSKPIHIVCAGTDGAITGEDVLFAGALVASLQKEANVFEVNDAAAVAVSHWNSECGDLLPEKIGPAIRQAQGGRNLIRLGYDEDITTASIVDSVSIVGIVDADKVICRMSGQAS